MGIVIKGKPNKPKRKTGVKEIYYGSSLGEAASYFLERGFDLDDVNANTHRDPYGACCCSDGYVEIYFEGTRPESSSEWNARLTEYNKKLAKYNEWYKVNKVEIEKELAKRAKKAQEVELKRLERELAASKKLEKKINKTKAKLEKLGSMV